MSAKAAHKTSKEYAMTIKAYGAHAHNTPLEPIDITRRATGAHDVKIDIAYCGICHSDLHQVRAEWEGTLYPCVPGHEIVGRVSAVGEHVSGFHVGDLVGVGCIVDSCKHCDRSEEHTSELQSLMRISYAVFCLKKKNNKH